MQDQPLFLIYKFIKMELTTLQQSFELSQDNISKLSFDILQAERELQETEFYKKLQELKNKKFEIEKQQEEYKNSIKTTMEINWIKKIELQFCNITLKNNPPALVISDEAMIPSEYKKEIVKVEIDKTQIKHDLKEWKEIFWCTLTQWTSLLITAKSNNLQ